MIQALKIVLQLAVLAVQLWPVVKELVKSAEAAFEAPKSGAEKFDAVMNGLNAVIESAPELSTAVNILPADRIQSTLTNLVNKAVAVEINKQPKQ